MPSILHVFVTAARMTLEEAQIHIPIIDVGSTNAEEEKNALYTKLKSAEMLIGMALDELANDNGGEG